MTKKLFFIFVCLLMLLIMPMSAYAHGVVTEFHEQTSYKIIAAYDTGDPMAEAQVIIYAPDDPTNPWKKGKCDEEGHYIFTPDFSIHGNWAVQIRQSGHGATVNIKIDEEGAAVSGGSGGYSGLQIIVMIACVIWGFVGTAFFFKRRN